MQYLTNIGKSVDQLPFTPRLTDRMLQIAHRYNTNPNSRLSRWVISRVVGSVGVPVAALADTIRELSLTVLIGLYALFTKTGFNPLKLNATAIGALKCLRDAGVHAVTVAVAPVLGLIAPTRLLLPVMVKIHFADPVKASFLTKKATAATTIQKLWRGHVARKDFLPRRLYPLYSPLCKKTSEVQRERMPQAPSGATCVFLPPTVPEVVLKQTPTARKRAQQMREVRAILRSQGSTRLKVPQFRGCGAVKGYDAFLVEGRLPISSDPLHNMEIYLSHLELFDITVREMVRLFSKIFIGDLISTQTNGVSVRYDNLPFFVTRDKTGSIEANAGLIDLEQLNTAPTALRGALYVLAIIFPFHLKVIQEEGERLGIHTAPLALEQSAMQGKEFLRRGLHLQWLKRKKITREVAPQVFAVSSSGLAEISQKIQQELTTHGVPANDLAQLASGICTTVTDHIKEASEKNIQRLPSKKQWTNTAFICSRSSTLVWGDIDSAVLGILQSSGIQMEARGLARLIFHELVANDEIFYFDDKKDVCFIRY